MVIIRSEELRELDAPAMAGKLRDVREELHSELGVIAAGGRPKNPGRIRELKRTIARILTIARQRGIDVEKEAKSLLPPPPEERERKEKAKKEVREEAKKGKVVKKAEAREKAGDERKAEAREKASEERKTEAKEKAGEERKTEAKEKAGEERKAEAREAEKAHAHKREKKSKR